MKALVEPLIRIWFFVSIVVFLFFAVVFLCCDQAVQLNQASLHDQTKSFCGRVTGFGQDGYLVTDMTGQVGVLSDASFHCADRFVYVKVRMSSEPDGTYRLDEIYRLATF